MATTTGSSRSKQQSSRGSSQSTKQTASSSARTSSQGTNREQSKQSKQSKQSRSTTVELPYVTAQFRVPEVHVPDSNDIASATDSVRAQLPSREQSLFYGGLAVTAAFSVIEWPVALAIGVGHALLLRGMHQHDSESSSGRKAAE